MPVTVADDDRDLDIALLRLDAALPAGTAVVPLAAPSTRLAYWQPVICAGWPRSRPFDGDLDYVAATIVSADVSIFGGQPALKLQSAEAAGGKPLYGLSGGPVLTSAGLRAGVDLRHVAVGITRWNQPGDGGAAVGGAFYATPMDAILRRFPVLQDFAIPAPRLPGTTAIERFLTDRLGGTDNPVPFGGRANELDMLSTWLNSPERSRCLLVTGPSGRGKSTLLARWWQLLARADPQRQAVFVPISLRYDLASAEAVLRAVVARLATVHGDDPITAVAGGSDQLRDLVAEYLSRPAPSGQLVVVVDGLDEALGWDVSPSLFSPREFADGVRLVVSARLTEQRPTGDAWLSALGWNRADAEHLPLDRLSSAGVGDAVRSIDPPLPDDLVPVAQSVLTPLSEGDALVLGFYLRDLQAAEDSLAWLERVKGEQRPPGLDGYLKTWWADQERLWGGRLASRGRHVGLVYSLLACALGPLRRRELLQLARRVGVGGGDPLDDALGELKRWVVVDSAESSYALSHPRLAEQRRDQLAADGELPMYDDAYLAWGYDVLQRVQADPDTARDADPYIVRFYGAHLERADRPPGELFRLVSPAWQMTWEVVATEFQGHLADIRRAINATAAGNNRCTQRGVHAKWLPEQIASMAALSDASANAALMSPELAGQLCRYRSWTDHQTLTYVQSLPSVDDRCNALRIVARYLTAEVTHEIEAILAATDPDDTDAYTDALVGYITHLVSIGSAPDTATVMSMVKSDEPGIRLRIKAELVLTSSDAEQSILLADLFADMADHRHAALPTAQMLVRSVDRETAAVALGGTAPGEHLLELLLDVPFGQLLDVVTINRHAEVLADMAPWLSDATRGALTGILIGQGEAKERIARLQKEIVEVRRAKDQAIDDQDFELAAERRGEEKRLLASAVRLERQITLQDSSLQPLFVSCASYLAPLFDMPELQEFVHSLPAPAKAAVLPWLASPTRERLAEELEDWALLAPAEEARLLVLRGLLEIGRPDVVTALLRSETLGFDDLENLAPLLSPDQLRSALEIVLQVRSGNRQRLLRPLIASLAALSPRDATRALELARQESRQPPLAGVAAPLLTGAAAAPFSATRAVENEALRCCAVSLLAGESVTTSELIETVGSFRAGQYALEALRTLLPRIPDEEVATDDVLAINDVLERPCSGPDADGILLRYLQRVAKLRSPRVAANLALRVFPLSPDVGGALAAAAITSTAPESDSRFLLKLIDDNQLLQPLLLAPRLRAVSDEEAQVLCDGIARQFVPSTAVLQSRLSGILIVALPERLRAAITDKFIEFMPFFLAGEGPFRAYGQWARATARLVPAFDSDQVGKVLGQLTSWGATVGHLPSSAKGKLYAAAAVRLGELGQVDRAFSVLSHIPYSPDRMTALAGLAETVATPDLGRWFGTVYQYLSGRGTLAERAMVWGRAAHRWRELSVVDAGQMVQAWTHDMHHEDRDDLIVDVVGMSPLFRLVGEDDAAVRIADLLELSRAPGGHDS